MICFSSSFSFVLIIFLSLNFLLCKMVCFDFKVHFIRNFIRIVGGIVGIRASTILIHQALNIFEHLRIFG